MAFINADWPARHRSRPNEAVNIPEDFRSGEACPLPVNITELLFRCRIHYRHGNSKSNQTDTNTTRGHRENQQYTRYQR